VLNLVKEKVIERKEREGERFGFVWDRKSRTSVNTGEKRRQID